MASPQKENGFIPIANEIMEAFSKYHLSGQEWQLVFAVIRKTYGFQKKCDQISYGQLSDMTGIKRSKVVRLMKGLYAKNIIGQSLNGDYHSPQNGTIPTNCLYFQKDYEKWGVVPKRGLSPILGQKGSPQKGTHKRQYNKIQYKEPPIVPHGDEFELFWKTYPRKVGKGAALKAWVKLKPKPKLDDILNTLSWQKDSREWTRDSGQYIPHPATYINQQRWLDEKPRSIYDEDGE